MGKSETEYIETSINAVSRQIELLSRKCELLDNKKDSGVNFQQVLDASSLMLQLTRSLNELIVTKRILENGAANANDLLGSFLREGRFDGKR